MQARYCDPTTGRFVSEDPGRNGENWYGCAGENPVNNVDLSGCKSQLYTDFMFALGGLATAVSLDLLNLCYYCTWISVRTQILSIATASAGLASACFAEAAIGMPVPELAQHITGVMGVVAASIALLCAFISKIPPYIFLFATIAAVFS
jgi:hypothetical protein